MQKVKQIAVVGVFGLLLVGMLLAHLLLPDGLVSTSERRKLEQLPEFTAKNIFSSEFSGELEEYILDQFPLRDTFRKIKAWVRFDVFQQMDNNGVYLEGDQVSKIEYPLQDDQVTYAGKKFAAVYEKFLQGMSVYYAVVPDKNYYLAEVGGYPALDYEKMLELLQAELPEEFQQIDLFDTLSIDDYYRTDSHWKQESIYKVASQLCAAMGTEAGLLPESAFTAHTLSPFYGVYCGQSALTVEPDTLAYLTNDLLDNAIVTSIEDEGTMPVYATELFTGMDGYDVFLSGSQSVITIEVPDAQTDRELIIFRDSYGSSIAPLLCGAYSKITLIDIRYVMPNLLDRFVEFADQDVLFLYSTTVLNSGKMLK